MKCQWCGAPLEKGYYQIRSEKFCSRTCTDEFLAKEKTDSPKPAADAIRPDHYRKHPSGVECIQIVQHFNFNVGNVIKYAWRAGLKSASPIEDLKKAKRYLEFEIERLEKENAK